MIRILIISTILGLCSSNWVIIWMRLEINTLRICYLISKDTKTIKLTNQPVFLYYLVQAIASLAFLIATTTTTSPTPLSSIIVLTRLITKIGCWPIHLWYIKLISNLEIKTMSILTIMRWQKILPLIVLSITKIRKILPWLIVIITGCILSSMAKLSKTISTKRIIALSSLNNNGWLIIVRVLSTQIFLLFLTIYALTLCITLKILKDIKTKTFYLLTFWSSCIILSNLGGLPPLSIFWAKVMVIKQVLNSSFPSEICILLIISACYLLYHYLWIGVNNNTSPFVKNYYSKDNKILWRLTRISVIRVFSLGLLVFCLGQTLLGLFW